ncbi:hypothetical protein PF002_g2260 [Phytophthora fragariae]|uniref:Uncharacterized protein n=1 Tax=Phytophthora fragariae TaxID=53985 RepID=A0A6A3SR26_9STRA|nr:hypothetical protein PF007_g7858 [Phytophthora fragariae]KAE9147457.1 hypothetical protein PF006_g7868 [Phytophthora fragariae]KAE9240204.1 hypothetical protein PF004_g7599 [Phytophthora fragariae]KAE9255625.1 hypothetical protein PF002_g2260 [Phytophthora fragariae]KAE9315285.1 hypothetical protein PF001_g7859 [Phytophthora fragariae]
MTRDAALSRLRRRHDAFESYLVVLESGVKALRLCCEGI